MARVFAPVKEAPARRGEAFGGLRNFRDDRVF